MPDSTQRESEPSTSKAEQLKERPGETEDRVIDWNPDVKFPWLTPPRS
jgi:hypothetical protein